MAESRPQSTTRLEKSAKRRQMIVETAASLFIEKGFHQTGMRDIAGKAGISLSNLYNHFKGKHEIIAAISELETAELDPLLTHLEDVSRNRMERLLQFAAEYFDLCSSPAHAALSAEIVAEVFRNPEIGSLFEQTRIRLVQAVANCLPTSEENLATLAELVIGLIECAGQNAVSRDVSARKQLKLSMLAFVERAVGAKPIQG
ncbi:TetR/AcrR family transcriptional regulator [Roseibium sp. LAB1]